MREHGHITCDVPGCGAIVPEDSPGLASWETLDGGEAPTAYLCPRCSERRRRGVLADPLGLWCVRCERTRADGVERWWGVRDGAGQLVDVCDDCLTSEDRTDVA